MQGLFVFVLLALFAMMSVLLVLFGAQMYRGNVEQMDANDDDRVLYSYVRSMVRAQDTLDSVGIEEQDGTTVLGMHEDISGTEYVTWIYEYDGKLYEQFTRADTEFVPDHGVEIIEVREFKPTMEGQLLTVEMVDNSGETVSVQTAVRCGA